MARGKRKTKKTRTKAAPRRRATKTTKTSPARKTAARASGKRSKASGASGVERHWHDYWQCRTKLEEAVAAVRASEKNLAAARDVERTCREVFDRTKESLKDLLEVEPASGAKKGPMLDFPPAEKREGETRGRQG